jgi:NAD(P)-dependent dehydrogenase (short-subunit alcohol dehydrogenase family)
VADGAPAIRRFAGRAAAVTGGAGDIGHACAVRLAAEGADVAVIDAEPPAVEATCRAIESHGVRAVGFVVDLADPDQAEPVARRCRDAGWAVDVLVTAPMETQRASVEDGDLAGWERVLRADLTGPYAWTVAFLPELRASGQGAVVHVGSVDGQHGNPAVPAYSAAKGGLIPLTRVMARDLGRYPVRVNLVCRVASTGSGSRIADPAIAERLRAATPLRRFGEPGETAAAVAFLASPEAAYITGATLVVDGGRTTITAGTA